MQAEPPGGSQTDRVARVLLVLVVVVSAVAQILRPESFVFEAEHDWLLTDARRAFSDFQLHSSPIGPTGFDHGPLFFLLVWPLATLLPSPEALRVVWILLAGAGALVLGETMRRRFGGLAALVTTAGLVGSWFWYETGRQLWHSSLLPLPMALFLAAALRYLEAGLTLWLACAGVAAAVCVQLHAQTAFLGFLTLGLFVHAAVRHGWRAVLLPAAACVVALLPIGLAAVDSLAGSIGGEPVQPPSYGTDAGAWAAALVRLASPPFAGSTTSLGGIAWLTLGLLGALVVVRRGPVFVGAFGALGLASLVPLVGWADAPRYLHVAAMPLFVFGGLGADALAAAVRARAPAAGLHLERAVVLGVAVAAIYGASRAPRPDASPPWLDGPSQALVAKRVAAETSDPARVHGFYMNDRGYFIGFGYFHDTATHTPPAEPLEDGWALAVLPADLALVLPGVSGTTPEVLGTHPSAVVVQRFRPRAHVVSANGRALGEVLARWQRHDTSGRGPFSLTVAVAAPGRLHVHIRRSGDPEETCAVTARVDGRSLVRAPVTYRGRTEIYALEVPTREDVLLDFAPCRSSVTVDVF